MSLGPHPKVAGVLNISITTGIIVLAPYHQMIRVVEGLGPPSRTKWILGTEPSEVRSTDIDGQWGMKITVEIERRGST
jgi:hypothetical protein